MPALVSVSNPYTIEQTLVVAALVFTFVLWAGMKPPAVKVLRVVAAFAAVATSCAVFAAEVGQFRTVEPECKFALQSSLLLLGCLVAELIGGRRDRIPRASARWLR